MPTTTALPKTCVTCGYDFVALAPADAPAIIAAHLLAHLLASQAAGVASSRDPNQDW